MSCFFMKPHICSCSVRVLAAIVIVVQATISLNSAALDEEEVSSLSLAVDFTAYLVENVSKFRSQKDRGFPESLTVVKHNNRSQTRAKTFCAKPTMAPLHNPSEDASTSHFPVMWLYLPIQIHYKRNLTIEIWPPGLSCAHEFHHKN